MEHQKRTWKSSHSGGIRGTIQHKEHSLSNDNKSRLKNSIPVVNSSGPHSLINNHNKTGSSFPQSDDGLTDILKNPFDNRPRSIVNRSNILLKVIKEKDKIDEVSFSETLQSSSSSWNKNNNINRRKLWTYAWFLAVGILFMLLLDNTRKFHVRSLASTRSIENTPNFVETKSKSYYNYPIEESARTKVQAEEAKVLPGDHDLLKIKGYFEDRHVVFCFMKPPRNSAYDRFEVEPIVALIKENLKHVSPKWLVHAITDSELSIQALSNIKGLQVVDMRNIRPSDRFLQFKATYIPQSENDIEYEAFCMWRWIIISDYFNELKQKGHPVNFIISLDTDVLLLDDPLTVDRQMKWSIMESYRIVDGAAVIWNLLGIDSFANFLVDSYSTREKAAELALQHGIRASCSEGHSLLIDCFFEEGHNAKLLMVHMSDMYWYLAWMQQNTELRFTNSIRGMDCYVAESLCDRSIRFIRHGANIYENSETQTKRFCLLHFQNWSKIFVLPFLSFLEGSSTEYTLNISNI